MIEKPKKPLSFNNLIAGFKSSWQVPEDNRRAKSIEYTLLDTLLSGLACMFYKSPSLLAFQERMGKKYHRNNLQTQFGVRKTPKDNQMREIMSTIDSETLSPVFKNFLTRLQRSNHLKRYQFDGRYLVTIDGTQYYSSKDVSCHKCLEKELRSGDTNYYHSVAQPIISHPELKQILPLMPEEISRRDGDNKQDCEVNAAKRAIDNIRKNHPRLSCIYMGDALYANTPYINKIREKDDKFIFRVKSGSHKHIFSIIDEGCLNSVEVTQKNGSRLVHKWCKGVELHKGSSITVDIMQLFSITTHKKTGKQKSTLVGTWATDLDVTEENIEAMVKAARARWKIENEAFNCLKNDGYKLTHNWGHVKGESFNFYILTLLAFYMHQILELSDQLYKKCREMTHAAYALWEELRVLFNRFLYESWDELLKDYIAGFKEEPT